MQRLQQIYTDYFPSLTALSVSFLLFSPYINANGYGGALAIDKLTLLFIIIHASLLIVSKILYLLSSIIIIIINIIYIHIVNQWGEVSFTNRISIALESPSNEQIDYLSTYLSLFDFAIAIFSITCALLVRYIIIRQKKPQKLFAFALLLLISGGSWGVSRIDRFSDHKFVIIPMEIYEAESRKLQVKTRNSIIANNVSVLPGTCTEEYQQIAIVIGESAYKNRLGLYGYKANTTSRLGELIPFRFNAFSAANQTRYAVPLMMTDATTNDFPSFFISRSIVSDLKACGYKTMWISNQSRNGKHDDFIASIANEADVQHYLNKNWLGEISYDEELIPAFENLHSHSDKKIAVFFHLAGSHFEYSRRFPKSFYANPPKNVGHAYDLSIQYTDKVLAQIFDSFSKEKLLFLYASDHGEIVSETKQGHGFIPAHKDEYLVPFLAWSSKPERLMELTKAVGDKEINMDSFHSIVRYLAGIDAHPTISYDTQVINTDPRFKVDFKKLAYFK